MCIAGTYNGVFYNSARVPLGNFVGGYPRVTNTQIINNNNINIVNVNQIPPRQVTTPTAAGKQPISTAVGKQGTSNCSFGRAL